MTFKIEFSQRSQRDLEEIIVYIRNDSPENAKNWRLKLGREAQFTDDATGSLRDSQLRMNTPVAKSDNCCLDVIACYSPFEIRLFTF